MSGMSCFLSEHANTTDAQDRVKEATRAVIGELTVLNRQRLLDVGQRRTSSSLSVFFF